MRQPTKTQDMSLLSSTKSWTPPSALSHTVSLQKMNHTKLWLAVLAVALLHSMCPPRVYEHSSEYAGRAFILLPTFYQADRMVWHSSMTDTPKQTAYHQRKQKTADNLSSWNPSRFDFGSYVAELVALLCIGGIVHLWSLLPKLQNQSEQ